ncbi:TPA: hypothetical protein ACW7YJ_003757 [Acinetobacter baumannii]|uniref:hypothetical protein n=1 Tax=Acinetobacter baumannii TaxID=470 RepID=UPI000A3AE791|nr:hypothetical protein [Acinetobacter baumannii]MBJ9485575.1 hypothetical protein [Acinetobacter baumannii]OTU65663.1 hypothetical protein CAT32_13045 [Acinetobacter baumannii]HEM7101683.1 hypothetical protein [Acinetobacter baumannii]
MDNYKIKVKNEAESKEAQELFFELGYSWLCCGKYYNRIGNYTFITAYPDEMLLRMGWGGDTDKELTLPQLQDLVVLKRNDVKDANCIDKKREAWYLASDGTYYAWQYRKLCWDTESDACVEAHDIKPINQPQDPALISGDVALANVHKCIVQYLHDDEPYGRWTTITDHFWSQYHLGMFLDPDTKFKFRFKPQTIKLELELPKPFEPEEDCHVYILDDGKTDGYRRYSYEVHGDKGNTFIGIWRTEEEIKQVVAQLRKIRGAS